MIPDGHSTRFAAVFLVAALGAGVAAGLTGCDGAEPEPSVSPRSASPGPSAPPTEAAVSEDDAEYVTTMARHHDQAVELAELAADRAGEPALAELAATIAVTQRAEAAALRAWLDRRGIDAEHVDHAAEMPGALSAATLERAATLHGAQFDRLFVDAMVRHHEGAVAMSEERLANSGDSAVARLARTIATTQSLEIDRLRELAPAGNYSSASS